MIYRGSCVFSVRCLALIIKNQFSSPILQKCETLKIAGNQTISERNKSELFHCQYDNEQTLFFSFVITTTLAIAY